MVAKVLAVLLFCGSMFGQLGGSYMDYRQYVNGRDTRSVCDDTAYGKKCDYRAQKHIFLLEYTVIESAYGMCYTMPAGSSDGGTSNITLNGWSCGSEEHTYFEWFEDEKYIVDFLNAHQDVTFKAVWLAAPVRDEIVMKEEKKEIPQPPVVEKRKTYTVHSN